MAAGFEGWRSSMTPARRRLKSAGYGCGRGKARRKRHVKVAQDGSERGRDGHARCARSPNRGKALSGLPRPTICVGLRVAQSYPTHGLGGRARWESGLFSYRARL
jgi:hypothetical protein